MKKWTFCMLLLVWISAHAQDYGKSLREYGRQYPVDRVHLQTDQEWYVPGETAWFKAYVFTNGQPALTRSNLFIQLVNPEGKLVSQHRYPLTTATAKGGFVLPDSLTEGYYFFRVITQPMLAYPPAFVYEKRIALIRTGEPVSSGIQATRLFFYPENGQLVQDVPGFVTVRATDKDGLPVATQGTILNPDKTVAAHFKTGYLGRGIFSFIPKAGVSYSATVQQGGSDLRYDFPSVTRSGVSLHVEDEPGGKMFQLSRSAEEKDLYAKVNLVVETGNQVVYENEIEFEDYYSVKGHLITEEMPSGVLHFTVFDNKGSVLAERFSFVDNQELRSTPSISVNKRGKGRRAENEVTVSFPEFVQRDFSITVTDISQELVPGPDLYTSILLANDLGQDLSRVGLSLDTSTSTRKEIDLILMSQTSSRNRWQDILQGNSRGPVQVPPYISITGKVFDDKLRERMKGGRLQCYLEGEDSTTQNLLTHVAEDGTFSFDSLQFNGNGSLYYAYTDKAGKQQPAKVVMDQEPVQALLGSYHFAQPVSMGWKVRPADWIAGRIQFAQQRAEAIKELERVTLKSKFKRPGDQVNEKYTTGVFKGQAKMMVDNVTNPISDKGINAVDFIRSRIQQVEVQGNNLVNRKKMSMRTQQRWLVGVFLNEAPTDLATLRLIRMTDVALIKFFDAGFVGVSSTFAGGAVAVYTKDPSEFEAKPDKLEKVTVSGYTVPATYPLVDYSIADRKQPAKDERGTLYWNPEVRPANGEQTFTFRFYNNDKDGPVRIIVEGFDAAGNLIRAEKVIR